ncbi:Alpha-1,3-glucosyltransferase [Trichophyton interdigitale]|uniref:Alpha-1,3-glucosyltransferase n=1 Tax=Trichophyton interdigitale TaxID=101480 RepID=A0A9P5CX58_9EURO|nr:Alpha-1,3-glucosyltransferase [Trichophyton interdigitale]KAF3900987.1 Alpha-1,3-glucosyltransferase [Trichophyton interdigitale]KAG8212542.1 Alpha-1,3-glucosyltransferase [Trichophyton interdigitale]
MAPPTPSSHRPRKKHRTLSGAGLNTDLVVSKGQDTYAPAFPLVSFFWPARSGVSQWLILPVVLMIVGLFRWGTSLWGHSGYVVPPMHGDFEAQRHWMELTIHLPTSWWYFYDLQYWGLDYPPLTAYHSWLLGKIGQLVDPTWFALDESRGLEGPLLRVYMRATVVVSEYLVYIPAVVIFLRRYAREQGVGPWPGSIALCAVLMQPSTILIDHGHFQYNTVMLGFIVASLESMYAGRPLWASIFFVAALGFKQMSLYFAPVVFAYLLGICFSPRIRPNRLLSIALITMVAFAVLFTPLLAGSLADWYRNIPGPDNLPPLMKSLPIQIHETSWLYQVVVQLTQCIHRIFPFARGLFEDKVANVWCAIHTFYKLNKFDPSLLKLAALGATLITIMPSCLMIGRYPRTHLLPYALASTGWGFFLCSFQVHEKSVLLPLLPMTLLLGSAGGLSKEIRAWVGLANMLGVWTMFPLLKRDELRIPYAVLTLLWAYLLGLPPMSLDLYRSRSAAQNSVELFTTTKLIHISYYAAMLVWHLLESNVAPPPTKPDLWVVLNALIGASGFGIIYLWCNWKLIQAVIFEPHQPALNPKRKRTVPEKAPLEEAKEPNIVVKGAKDSKNNSKPQKGSKS